MKVIFDACFSRHFINISQWLYLTNEMKLPWSLPCRLLCCMNFWRDLIMISKGNWNWKIKCNLPCRERWLSLRIDLSPFNNFFFAGFKSMRIYFKILDLWKIIPAITWRWPCEFSKLVKWPQAWPTWCWYSVFPIMAGWVMFKNRAAAFYRSIKTRGVAKCF